METAIISGLVREVLMSLGGLANYEIAMVLGVKDEINKLERSLQSITHGISEISYADRAIVRSEGTDVRLKELKEIAYEAENIVDRFKIKMSMLRTSQFQVINQAVQPEACAMRQILLKFQEWSGPLVCRSCREVDARYHTAKLVEKLNKRLEDMTASRRLYQDLEAMARRYQPGSNSSMVGPCHDESSSIGIAISNACDDHIRRLRGGGGQALFAIVGAPGVGKSALAQKIYNEMKDQFGSSRLWVHMSSGTGNLATTWLGDDIAPSSSQTPEQQKVIIRQRLTQSSRLLVVIDNVWDKDGWGFLGTQQEGFFNRGVRVVVTTPNWDVARSMGVNMRSCCHNVMSLDEHDGWQLLQRTARLKERDVGDFQDVGRKIVRKCSGIPLALEAVGDNLRSKDKVKDWEDELDRDFIVVYEGIRKSMDAIYMELGYRLKRCFLYCSLYPEGSVIKQQHIMQQWIAEGFFEGRESNGGQQGTCPVDPEKEAQKCYTELLNRSLLLPKINGFATMPTLLRSYAIYRSEDENYVGDNPSLIGPTFKVWRLCALHADTVRDIPDDMTNLRTLLVFGSSTPRGYPGTGANLSVMDVICRKFTSLRVLDLRDTQVVAVGNNIGRLLQLRYLNLSSTRIRKLPRQVRKLVMLQSLILKNCPCLESLPRSVGRLKNLRSLDISGTPELQAVNFRLPNLKELKSFRGFIPVSSSASTGGSSSSSQQGWTFMELSSLSQLTSLQILKLGRSTSSQETAELKLHEKSNLKELELCCTPTVGHGEPSDADAESIRGVLGAIKPPQDLNSLKLVNFYGSELPCWVSSRDLSLLERLTLDGCSRCQRLPSLGDMRRLKFLAITGSRDLTDISSDLRGVPRNVVAFRLLEQLALSKMEYLQTWSGLEAWDMPLLRSLQLSECPRLRQLPPWLQHCKALVSLKIESADELVEIRGLPALKALHVDTCRTLRRISNFDSLEDLKINCCFQLNAVHSVPLLRSLHLHEHAAELPQWVQKHKRNSLLRSLLLYVLEIFAHSLLLLEHAAELPQWLQKQKQQQPFALRRLEIVGGEGLLDMCSSELAPYWPVIKDAADHVYAKLHDGSVYFSYTRDTNSLHRSQRCIERANIYGDALERLAPRRMAGDREARMRRPLISRLFAAMLICFAVQYLILM